MPMAIAVAVAVLVGRAATADMMMTMAGDERGGEATARQRQGIYFGTGYVSNEFLREGWAPGSN